MDPEQKSIERLQAASEMSLHAYGLPLVVSISDRGMIKNYWRNENE